MPFEIKEVATRRQLREFIYLPAKIHCHHPNWVPPIYSEEWKYFNRKKNKSFSYCEAILLLAYDSNKPVGRIMGIVNQRYNLYYQEKNARFAYLECWDDQEVFHKLLSHIENWAKGKGMVKIVGPMGFSDQEPEGFLVEGFEHTPTLATYCNFEFIVRLLEKEGYGKEVNYVVYKVNLPREIPDFYRRIYERVSKRREFISVEFSRRKQLKPYIRPVLRLMNDCYKEIYGFYPLNEEEMDEFVKRYYFIVDPRFVKIVTKNNEVIGFQIAIPNMSEGIRKAEGHLLPFGIFKILRSAKTTKQLDLMLGGIKENYRGKGVDVMLGLMTMTTALRAGLKHVDSHHELETNYRMRAEMERLGGEVYKRFRIFQKKLQ